MSLAELPDSGGGRRSRRRPGTSTANFGSGRREGHDATAFYSRFVAPAVSTDERVNAPGAVDVIHTGDARDMSAVPDDSVALVVTSPPYFAGKKYEESLGENGVPSTYFEFLTLLRDVFAECVRVLEPGGRIAVNVANLGRRPYRSLSADVTNILEELGLLLRGEIVWVKGRAPGGSCAWGTFQSPANPVLRDVTERIIIAGKGRFDRSLRSTARAAKGLPAVATITRDEFMEATSDLWEIAPERATKVGHPAPFPVELPQRLIELYTYEDDVVLDPFMGSGSTAVASVRTGRRFVGFDTDPAYVAAATARITTEQAALASSETEPGDAVDAAIAEGQSATAVARLVLELAGFADIRAGVRPRGLGIDLGFVATDATGLEWAFDVAGAFTTAPSGLRRSDMAWRSIAKAAVLRDGMSDLPFVLLSTEGAVKGSPVARALATVTGIDAAVADVIVLGDADDRARLAQVASGTSELGKRRAATRS